MRLATLIEDAGSVPAVVRGDRILPIAPELGLSSIRAIASTGIVGLSRIRAWAERQPRPAYRSLAGARLGPVVTDPGAIYAIGRNYGLPGEAGDAGSERPLVYGKAPTSVAGDGEVLDWDRSLTANVDAEVELGVVIGAQALDAGAADALARVFGYTCINDVSSRDPWLDGDQWLLGKSMPGFCPVGPWLVTPDELDARDLRLGCTINGEPIQDGRTSDMRFSIADIVDFLSRHVRLRPGDLIATGTPARLAGPPGPDRHLRPGERRAGMDPRTSASSGR